MRRKGENLGKAVYLGIVAGMLVSLVLILLAAVLMAMGIGSENPAKLFSGIQYFAAAWAGAVSGSVAADIFCPAEDGVGCPRNGVIDELVWPRSRGLATAFIGHYF
jgi:hypothetical protein